MEMHDYIETLTGQIRCKKARGMVADEISRHIHDQTEAYEKDGMEKESASQAAVKSMGDPVEAGMALDRIHRPRMNWSMLVAILVLMGIGLVAQWASYTMYPGYSRIEFMNHSILYNCVSLALILGIYFIDYTILGKYALQIWFVFWGIAILLLQLQVLSYDYWTMRGFYYVLLSICAPLFGGVIFRFRNKGTKGLVLSGLCLLLSIYPILYTSSISVGAEQMICMGIMLSVAVIKGWYTGNKKVQISLIVAVFIGVPALYLIRLLGFGGLESYQAARIKMFFAPASDSAGMGYSILQTRKNISEFTLFGNGAPMGEGSEYMNNYIITNIFSYFGILLGVVVLAVVAAFLLKAFRISTRQKNRLGYLVGLGCSMVLLTKAMVYVMANFGIGVLSQTNMPFLSFGLRNALVNAVLAGLLLSIYRHKEITSEKNSNSHFSIRFSIQKAENQ